MFGAKKLKEIICTPIFRVLNTSPSKDAFEEMANQRKKGKKLIGTYVDKKERDAFMALCKRENKSVAEKIRELIAQSIPPQ